MTTFETLQTIGTALDLPVCYSHFRKEDGDVPQQPPYLVYIGAGQDTFQADDTHYWRRNRYQVEYYFKDKNEQLETDLEDALLGAGLLYEKSDDAFIESEGVFVIYYTI